MRLRIPPDSGGSFGIKLSVFPYVVLMALAAKITGRPVKWTEDRIEHLVSASSGPNRVTVAEAAVTKDGRILGLKLDQLEDYGAFLRAPMPGPLYRMHGAVTGAYDIANVDVKNRVVLTNKMPASLIRGFGEPQLHLYARKQLMQRIAIELKLDQLDVIRKNPGRRRRFPAIRIPPPARCMIPAIIRARSRSRSGRAGSTSFAIAATTRAPRERNTASALPRWSRLRRARSPGYLSTLLTPQARDRAGPKNGAVSMATVNIDPLGAVTVTADVTVQGQRPRKPVRCLADRRRA